MEAAANSFEAVAREWLEIKSPEWVDETAKRATAWLENNVFPVIGKRPIGELEYNAPALLDVLQRMVKRGAVDSAHRVREHMGSVFRYAIATGRAKHDPVADLRDALPKAQGRNFAALTKPDDIAGLLSTGAEAVAQNIVLATGSPTGSAPQAPEVVAEAEQSSILVTTGSSAAPARVPDPSNATSAPCSTE